MTEQIINNRQSLDAYKAYLDAQFEKHKYLRVTVKNGKQRSLTENASLHLYCTNLAKALNDAGFDFRLFLKDGIDVPFTMHLVKENLWRPIQVAATQHESTTKPVRGEYGEVYEILSHFLSSKHGIYVPWPCKETLNAELKEKM